MTTGNIHEAKTQFSRLLNRVATGEEITIAKAGRAVSRLVPVTSDAEPRVPGMDAGSIWVSEDFDAALPEELLRDFEE